MKIRAFIASTSLVVAGIASIGIAPSAQAATGGQTITLKARVAGSAIASASGDAKVMASTSTFDYVAAQVKSKAKTTRKCYMSPGWNFNPGVGWHYETVPMKVCKLAKPRKVNGKLATHLKKGGGASGSACDNWARPTDEEPSKASPAVLDLKMGQKGVVKTAATAAADTSASVDVFLEYTYNGETLRVTETVDAVGSAEASAKDKAKFKMAKRFSVKASGGAISQAKARAESKAKARAKSKAEAEAKSKAEAAVELTVTIEIPGPKDLCEEQPGHPDCQPPKEDTPPEMTCTGMEHIFYGEDRMAYDFDAFDADGHAISFGAPVVTGPLNVVTTERSVYNGKQRLTVWITAQHIPEGTSQAASVKVIATANGKSVPCTVNLTVENGHTGWKASA